MATLLILAGGLLGANVLRAQRPAAVPPVPTPPAAGAADKPTSDALAQEAEIKPKEPEDEKVQKKYKP